MSSEGERMAKLEDLLNEAWREHRGEVLARVDTLRETLSAARGGTLTESARAEANSTAHKLAGVLGTFGLREASRAALEIERTLAPDAQISEEKLREYEGHLRVIGQGMLKRDAEAAA
jgi:HPt (histidine-containing phosphotransfer) domain-containing protein